MVARAYGDLEWEGVLKKHPDGGMVVVAGADVVCRQRIAYLACQRLREAVRHAKNAGLTDAEIKETIEQTLTAPPVPTLTQEQLRTSIKKSTTHATSHRDSQGIQDLSR